MRVGGFDVLFEGLKNQTFTDFELVISDGLYKHRKDTIEEKSKEFGFRVKHVEPFENPFPMSAFSRYANSALAHADCELVLSITDYTWLPPDSLQIHSDFHKQNPTVGLMSPHQYTVLPELHSSFPVYTPHSNEDTERYAADVGEGKLSDFMWSIFAKPYVSGDPLGVDPIMGGADPKLCVPAGPIASYYFNGKHESCGLNYLLAVNGWDEDLDETHTYQDTDIGERLEARVGLTWQADPINVAYIINPRHVFPWARRMRPVDTNREIYLKKKSENFINMPNKWLLKSHSLYKTFC